MGRELHKGERQRERNGSRERPHPPGERERPERVDPYQELGREHLAERGERRDGREGGEHEPPRRALSGPRAAAAENSADGDQHERQRTAPSATPRDRVIETLGAVARHQLRPAEAHGVEREQRHRGRALDLHGPFLVVAQCVDRAIRRERERRQRERADHGRAARAAPCQRLAAQRRGRQARRAPPAPPRAESPSRAPRPRAPRGPDGRARCTGASSAASTSATGARSKCVRMHRAAQEGHQRARPYRRVTAFAAGPLGERRQEQHHDQRQQQDRECREREPVALVAGAGDAGQRESTGAPAAGTRRRNPGRAAAGEHWSAKPR